MEGQVIAEIGIIPVGTIIQGPLERILELVPQMHRAPFARGAQKVVTTVSIDERRDKPQTMESKVEVVLGGGP